MKYKTPLLVILIIMGFSVSISAQTDETISTENTKEIPAFRSSRLIYGRSAQTSKANSLDIRISGRFGRVGDGFDGWFGIDTSFIRIGADYGITDNLMVSFGRSKLDKEFDLSSAYKILQQTSGSRNVPITMSILAGVMCTSVDFPDAMDVNFGDRLSTMVQLLIARNFMDRLTLQVAPVWTYNGLKNNPEDSHHVFSIGLGGHLKLSKRFSINVEYYPLFDDNKFSGTRSPLAVGVDIETWGHVFQFFVGNSMAPSEHLMLTRTTDKWSDGHLHIGFNLSRTFKFGKDTAKSH